MAKCAIVLAIMLAALVVLPVVAMAAEAASEDALKTALAGTDKTITLTGNIVLDEKLVIDRDVTITGKKTITRDASYTGTLFEVKAGAVLTLDGGLTIDGGNNYSFDQTKYENDLKTLTQVAKADAEKYFMVDAGDPVATAYMMTVAGELNLNNVAIKNHYSTNGSGLVNASNGAKVTLDGAKITHCASTQGSGLVVNASAGAYEPSANKITVTMNEGTVIDGNHVGGNHGIFKIYLGTVFEMNGGEIKNTTGWNSNGSAVGVYWATFKMNGGKICSNSSVYGPNNGRNAAIYLHSASQFTMTNGTICHNYGGSRGGLDAPYTDVDGNASQANISGGNIENNGSVYADKYDWEADVNGGVRLTISGGEFTQDVSQWCIDGFGAYENPKGVFTVMPESQIPTPTPAPTATPVPDTSDLPQTGDNSNLALFALLLTASAAGMLLLMRRKGAQE